MAPVELEAQTLLATETVVAPRRSRGPMLVAVALAATVGAAVVASSSSPAASGAAALAASSSSPLDKAPVVHAFVDALCPDCRRHALSLHEYMLSKSDVLGAIDLKVDYLGGASSIAEHGYNLVDVNKYELCAQNTLEQYEWWPMVHCMYGLQNCMNYNASAEARAHNQTAAKAERGSDDDLALSGDDVKGLSQVECSLTGVVDYCSSKHTSTDLATLKSCVDSSEGASLAKASDTVARAANGGVPLWVKINNQTISRSTNENKTTLEAWAYDVLRATCTELEKSQGEEDQISSCSERRQ